MPYAPAIVARDRNVGSGPTSCNSFDHVRYAPVPGVRVDRDVPVAMRDSVHFGAALNVGVTVEELAETIIQTAPYAGFATPINWMSSLKQVAVRPVAIRSSDE